MLVSFSLSPRLGDFCQGTCVSVWKRFWLSQAEGSVLLAAEDERPWMLLKILQCRGPPLPTTENSLAQSISSTEAEKPWNKLLAAACLG